MKLVQVIFAQALINWAEYDQLAEGLADKHVPEYGKRPPIQLISIELVQRLARQMQSGVNMTPGPFLTLLPVGWYRVEYQAQVEGSDNLEPVRQLIMVFENERDSYERFVQHIATNRSDAFEKEDVALESVLELLRGWQAEFFPGVEQRFGTNLTADLFKIARHVAQNGSTPRFFDFEQRNQHNLDAIATEFILHNLGPRVIQDALRQEYNRTDRLWSTIYPRFDLFTSEYGGCQNRQLHGDGPSPPPPPPPPPPPDREPSEEVKQQVKERDGKKCLACSWASPKALEVDHIFAYYYSGNNRTENLQTLCGDCNRFKGTQTINFRNSKTDLTEPPQNIPNIKPPTGHKAADLRQCKRYLWGTINFFYRCGAVHHIDLAAKGDRFYHWTIELAEGNDPEWLKPHLEYLLVRIRQERQKAGYGMPESLTVVAPGKNAITFSERPTDAPSKDGEHLPKQRAEARPPKPPTRDEKGVEKDRKDREIAKNLGLRQVHFQVLRALRKTGPTGTGMTYEQIEKALGYVDGRRHGRLPHVLHTDAQASLVARGLARMEESHDGGRSWLAFRITAKGRKLLEKVRKK